MESGIPVVYIRGLLESGKTTFLQDAIVNGDFGDVGKTLILSLEQGEIEYDENLLKRHISRPRCPGKKKLRNICIKSGVFTGI